MYILMSSKYTSYGIVVTVGPAVMLIFVFFIMGSAQYATALGELVTSLSDVRLSSTKIVQISANQSQKSPATATFTNDNVINQNQRRNNNSSQIKSITYTAKFECGSIVASEGPLRPGHYDTNISIFNRQDYPVNILLDIVINGDANKANPIIKTIQPQTSTGIVCRDIYQVLGIGDNISKALIEGFVLIRLDVNGGILNSLLSTVGGGSTAISSSPVTTNDINNFLDVNVFYTANARVFAS